MILGKSEYPHSTIFVRASQLYFTTFIAKWERTSYMYYSITALDGIKPTILLN